jgi:CMP-N,N'-diacetyllegionaminic acid synthase
MINGKRVIAIITARGGSKGLPRKNARLLKGVPLVNWPILAAKNSRYVDRVIVSTDDPEIAEIAKLAGSEVPFIRPADLATDSATTFSVLQHALADAQIGGPFSYVVLLEPTSPLTGAEDIDSALELLDSKRQFADSLVGVCKLEAHHPHFVATMSEDGLLRPYALRDFSLLGRRQELTNLYFFEGSVYVSDIPALLREKSFYHDRTLGFVMPKWKSLEIDDAIDWICIEAILEHRADLESSVKS